MSDNLEKFLMNLISINSSNPDYSESAPGEKEIGDYVEDFFHKNKIDCIKQEVVQGRSNIIATVSGAKTGPSILLCSHLDTVFVEGMKFKSISDDKNIYGPGACDTKASLAVMIKSLVEYSKYREKNLNMHFLGAVSEESRHLGIKKFMDTYKNFIKNIDFCIIGEPTSLDIGIAHKGSLKFTIKTSGKSAHGSTPDLGLNAINMMCELINNINKKIIPFYEESTDNLLGNATLNIGVIKGGNAFNIVPDSCYIEVDRRVLPSENIDEVLEKFSYLISVISRENKNFFAKVEKINDYIPYLIIDETDDSVKRFNESCNKFYAQVKMKGLSYATDGGFTFQGGIPTIVFGPGNIKESHKLGEYVSKKQLQLAFQIFKNYFLNF